MRSTHYALTALALAVSAGSAFAQDGAAQADGDTVLETTVVTGDWLLEPKKEKVLSHAGARTVIDRQEFEKRGASNIRDVLNEVPGVQVQDSNGTGGSDMSLNLGVRGLTSRLSPRSTVLMDGVPLSYAPYGGPQLSIFPLTLGAVESVDVIRGAGSVRYGPQNVGGIINFTTRPIPEKSTALVSNTSEISGENGHVKSMPSVFVGGTSDNGFGGAILYSGIHGEGYRSGSDRSDIDDILLKGKYTISDTDDISLNLHHYEGEGRMPGGLTPQEYDDDPYQTTRKYDMFGGHRTDVSLRYQHDDGVNSFDVLTYYVDTFRTSGVEKRDDNGKYSLAMAPRNFHYFGIEPRYSRLFIGDDVTQEVTVGYRYLEESNAEKDVRTLSNDIRAIGGNPYSLARYTRQTSSGGTRANAFYIDDRIDIGNWTITPGVRYEMIDTHNTITEFQDANGAQPGAFKSSRTPKVSYNEALPTLSIAYRINDYWSVFTNAGISFGPMQYNQLADGTDGLSPEKAKTYEIGTHYESDDWSAEVTAFYIDFDEEMFLDKPTAGDSQWTNLGATKHHGVETSVHHDFSDLTPTLGGLLSAYASYTYTEATYEAGAFKGYDLPFYSQHVGSVGANYQRDRWNFSADVSANSKQHSPGTVKAGSKYITDEDETGRYGDIPGYGTVGVRAAYQVLKDESNSSVAIGVRNLFDKNYFTRSTDNNGGKFMGQPRTFYVSASIPL